MKRREALPATKSTGEVLIEKYQVKDPEPDKTMMSVLAGLVKEVNKNRKIS